MSADSEDKENGPVGHKILKHTFDSASNRILLATSNQQLIVFSLASTQPKPEGTMKFSENLFTADVESMLLFPHHCTGNSSNLFGSSLLCLLSKSKQMYVLENQKLECPHLRNPTLDENESGQEKQAVFSFVDMLNRRKQNGDNGDNGKPANVTTTRYNLSQFNSAKLVDEMFYNVPSHVLPPIEVIAKTFLNSLQVGGIPLDGERTSTESGEDSAILYDKDAFNSDTRQPSDALASVYKAKSNQDDLKAKQQQVGLTSNTLKSLLSTKITHF